MGVVGVTTPDMKTIGRPPAGLEFSDPIQALPGCIAAMRQAHPDVAIIVVLSHVGYDVDRRIAEQVGGVM